jgi:hypothetical protein
MRIETTTSNAGDQTNDPESNKRTTLQDTEKEHSEIETSTGIEVVETGNVSDNDENDSQSEPDTDVKEKKDSKKIDSEQIQSAIKEHLDPEMLKSDEFIKKLGSEIAAKLYEFQNGDRKETKKQESDKFWMEYDDYIVCTPCSLYHKRKDVPKKHKSSIKEGFGIITKDQKKHHITRSKNYHCGIGLHGWCVDQYEKGTEQKLDHEQENFEAGKKVIINAIFCFQRSLSSEEFVALNAKDYFTNAQIRATRNDSKANFFRLRDIIFDIISEKTRKYFQENVKAIAVTLDKGAKYLGFFLLSFPQNKRKVNTFPSKIYKLGKTN